jgi:hypothetical protein
VVGKTATDFLICHLIKIHARTHNRRNEIKFDVPRAKGKKIGFVNNVPFPV